jgi:pimeloyl-ACP methyl ester carboxylesterase
MTDRVIAARAGPPDWYVKAIGTPGTPISAVVDGVRVRARRWGDHGPGCLLVHGGAANARWWDHLAPLLAEDYRVVAVDLSGHGDSDHRDSYGARVWARELPAIADAGGLRPPYFAIAHSVGGWVALRAAQVSPTDMAGIVLIDSTLRKRSGEHAQRFGERALDPPRTFDSEAELLRRFQVVPDDPWIQPYMLEHIGRNSVRRAGEKWVWKHDRKIFARSEWQAEELLAAAPCRVGLLRASDGMINDDEARRTSELLGGSAPIITIPETGHHAHLDAPVAVLTGARTLLGTWQATT